MRKPDAHIKLEDADRNALETMASHGNGRSPKARRARLLLLAADGWSNEEICEVVGCTSQTVTCWRRRWSHAGLEGLQQPRRALQYQSCSAARRR
jgi:DNA-directed RNA polymerase specialized sigma24 family protein